MRILYVCHFYPPEMGAPAARVSELSRRWVQRGHDVTVLTGFPNQPTGVVPPPYRDKLWRLTMREQLDGVNVVRSWVLPTANRRARQRILNLGSFFASASARGTFLRRPDVVVATSPQLLAGLAGWWISRAKRVPLVFEVRDLWPESLLASGVSRPGSWMIRTLDRIARHLYRSCDRIVVVTEAMKADLVENREIAPERVSVIENGVNIELFHPMDRTECRTALGLDQEKFIVSYIGTLGVAQGLSTVLETAAKLRARVPHSEVLFVGAGSDQQALERQAVASGMEGLRFLPEQPREKVPQFIGASDVCLVTLRKAEVFKTVIPSKMLEFMACARPVALAVEGHARSLLHQAEAGISVSPENADEMAAALTEMESDPEGRKRMGASGEAFIHKRYRREEQADRYLELLDDILKKEQ